MRYLRWLYHPFRLESSLLPYFQATVESLQNGSALRTQIEGQVEHYFNFFVELFQSKGDESDPAQSKMPVKSVSAGDNLPNEFLLMFIFDNNKIPFNQPSAFSMRRLLAISSPTNHQVLPMVAYILSAVMFGASVEVSDLRAASSLILYHLCQNTSPSLPDISFHFLLAFCLLPKVVDIDSCWSILAHLSACGRPPKPDLLFGLLRLWQWHLERINPEGETLKRDGGLLVQFMSQWISRVPIRPPQEGAEARGVTLLQLLGLLLCHEVLETYPDRESEEKKHLQGLRQRSMRKVEQALASAALGPFLVDQLRRSIDPSDEVTAELGTARDGAQDLEAALATVQEAASGGLSSLRRCPRGADGHFPLLVLSGRAAVSATLKELKLLLLLQKNKNKKSTAVRKPESVVEPGDDEEMAEEKEEEEEEAESGEPLFHFDVKGDRSVLDSLQRAEEGDRGEGGDATAAGRERSDTVEPVMTIGKGRTQSELSESTSEGRGKRRATRGQGESEGQMAKRTAKKT